MACAQSAFNPQPVRVASAVKQIEGTDSGSGVHYLRFSIIALQADGAAVEPARLTIECRDKYGKHDLLWYVSFGGGPEQSFEPPSHSTNKQLFPPPLPPKKLAIVFEGCMKSKPFARTWVVEPSGELR